MDAPRIKTATIAGGAAGNHTVAAINLNDILISVQEIDIARASLVSEFTVSADTTINNTGGTDTTGHTLLIMWYSMDHYRDQFSGDVGTMQGRSPF